ncbi:peptidoglycan D,D-transpeptidase FtsI family protein [Goodfellowiella coeruleoviolacea]|uniref:Cell division protein FtsI (Penicillin-binding protein 3) n=1 Tax=Goodfellowiella coeruleoviolacea TaxID=334858 RepID=A0AAE3GKZ1_9PSEU|nr:penicillin-binding protein 2 [Goodfellowiella coeruleoviolacea]MCP2169548.1 cell division protein FtsI (penicillin-binding protein 3) [Goodfellowiella coeruleoviolacea]
MPRIDSGRPQRSASRRPLSVRGPARKPRARFGNHRVRIVVSRFLLVAALVAAGIKLINVQVFQAEAYSQRAMQQKATLQKFPAERGSIVDRNGGQLAFSVETRELYASPNTMRKEQAAATKDNPKFDTFEQRTQRIASYIHQVLGDQAPEQEMLDKLRSEVSYVSLKKNVDPNKARQIRKEFPQIGAAYRAERVYPNGELAANIIGAANWRTDVDPEGIHGLLGLEHFKDDLLAGQNGERRVDTALGNDDWVIPGSERDLVEAVPGSDLELTIDTYLQFQVQRMISDYVAKSGARNGSAVVLDARTGEVYALATDKTFNPADFGGASPEQRNNIAVTTPFEPGSVAKVITAAAGIEYGVVRPDTVLQVPGQFPIADRVVKDAWTHGTVDMTFTGVLGKSSNVGTLMVAQQVGADRFMDMVGKFGLGKRTEVGLPGESAGVVPPRDQWSGSTFGNLPIGQGMSMTLLQMAGMYQAIANDGVRVPPRIVRATIGPDGVRHEEPRPEGVRVVSPETATTVRDMMRAVAQRSPGQTGSGPDAALPGYQISGKTGTGQQVDPTCNCYSETNNNITFAGILPADNPRFVVGIMLDAPHNAPYSSTAAPLFHDIASYLAQRYQIPLSKEQSPVQILTP